MNEITAKPSLAECVAFPLIGPCRLRADDLLDGDSVVLYEERVDGEYEPAKKEPGVQITLTKTMPSRIVEGYGNYKALTNRDGIEVGYAD